MRIVKTKGRPLRRHPLPDIAPSTDPVFTRLIKDVQQAKRVLDREFVTRRKYDAALDLERGAFQHMFNYLNARAWVRTDDTDA
jgi:hypothetical protein